MTILAWHEMPSEDVPPEYLWEDEKGLKEHWDMVRTRSKEKYGTGNSTQMETVPMAQNDLARELKG